MLGFNEVPRTTNDVSSSLLDQDGLLKTMDASFYRDRVTANERLLFANRHAAYVLPTFDLVGFLWYVIGGRRAIEIGSGNGALARALDIQGTDSFQQEREDIRAYYDLMGQPTVRYGRNVDRLPALDAIAKYRPQVVIGAWVTHLDDTPDGSLRGNMHGIDEAKVIASCETYLMVGNRKVHKDKPIWKIPHRIVEPDWLFSRSHNGTRDFIACWGKADRFP